MKKQLESALRYLKNDGDITQACIKYSKTTNSSAAIVGLLRVRELINIALQPADAADGSIAGDEETFNNGEGW